MEMEFSRIEAYLNAELSVQERSQFEKELLANKELAERLDFYKKIKTLHTVDLKPIEFNNKILPDINNINFTEKKESSTSKKGLIAGISVLIIVSTFFLLTNWSNERKIASFNFKNDSLSMVNKKLEEIVADISGNNSSNNIGPNNETLDKLNKQIKEKEVEIALLKLGNNSDQSKALISEVENLKKELAKVKQEYFENAGQFANEKKADDIVKSIRFINNGDNLKIRWKSTNKYKVEICNTDNIILNSTGELVVNEWIIKDPGNGFYILKFITVNGEKIEMLLELKEYSKIWLPN
jgi:hypothetical protein